MSDLRNLLFQAMNRRTGRTRTTQPASLPSIATPRFNPNEAAFSVNQTPQEKELSDLFLPKPAATAQPMSAPPPLTPSEQQVKDLLNKRGTEASRVIESDESKLQNHLFTSKAILQNQQKNGDSSNIIGGNLRGLFTKSNDEIAQRDKNISKIDKQIKNAPSLSPSEQQLRDLFGNSGNIITSEPQIAPTTFGRGEEGNGITQDLLPEESANGLPAAPAAPLTSMQKTEREINRRQNKDWKTKQRDGGAGDNDHNWWDVVKSAGLGFANGGLGGAIKGGISGAFDANADEKILNEQKLAGLYGDYSAQSKIADDKLGRTYREAQTANIYADNETAKVNAETRRQTGERNSLLKQLSLAKRYKRGENPALDQKLEAVGIEQPDFEADKKIKPRYWEPSTGKLMTFDEYGATVPVTRPDGTEIVAGSRKEVESGGYTVMPGAALNAESRVESSRVTAGNQTLQNEREYKVTVAKLNSKIASSNKTISSIKNSLGAIGTPTTQEAYNQKIQLEKELRAEESELAGYEEEKRLTPAPVEVQGVTGNASVSKSQVEAFAKQKGISYEEALKKAQDDGYTIK